MDRGYMKQIRERILSAEAGTIFATSDFADVADSATVRQNLKVIIILSFQTYIVQRKRLTEMMLKQQSIGYWTPLKIENYLIVK